MGTRQSTMDTERLTAMDHLEPIQSPTPEEQGDEARILPEAPAARGVTGTSLSYEGVVEGSRLISVGQLQSEGLRKLLLDGIVITAIYFAVGILWLMTTLQWGFTDTVYFMVISVVTVGYGDVTVGTQASDKVLDSLLIVIGLAALSTLATYAARVLKFRRLRGESLERVSSMTIQPTAGDAVLGERRWLFGAVLGMAGIICVGMVVFMLGEDTDLATGFYWAVVTASTIGYGDVVPTTFAMRWFTVFYVVVAAMWMVETLRMVGTFPFTVWTRQAEAKVYGQFDVPNTAQVQEPDRANELMRRAVVQTLGISPEREDSVNRAEFALGMLLLLDRISYKEYLEAATVYDKLKSSGSASVVRPAPDAPSEKR